MRILMMPASYPPVLGGLQTASHALARHLIAQSHEVRVLTSRYPRILPRHEQIDGVPVRRVLMLLPQLAYLPRRPDLWGAGLAYAPPALLQLEWLMRRFRPDVLNVHFPDVQIPFVRWLRRRFQVRLVVSLHGHEILRYFQGEQLLADTSRAAGLRVLLRDADVVTACSGYLLDKAAALEPAVAPKGHAIANGVDLERFTHYAAHVHQRPYLLAFGRLTQKKGFDLLIDAFAQVAAQWADVDLILAGEGEQGTALQQQIQRLGLAQRVHLYGRAAPADVVRLLYGSIGVAVPSRAEPFGIVALEAQAAARPLLATNVGGLPEIVPARGGVLVEPSVEGLAYGLCRLLSQRETLAAYAQANQPAIRAFSWSNSAAAYAQYFG